MYGTPTFCEAPTGRAPVPRAETTQVCDCGQDLDDCATAHCPRCGTALSRHHTGEHLERGPLGWVA